MNVVKMISTPLFAATALLALAGFWAKTYTEANFAARDAEASLKSWTDPAPTQMEEVGQCEISAKAKSKSSPLGPSARQLAWECSAPYLSSQPKISSSVAAQALGYAASGAMFDFATGAGTSAFSGLDAFYAQAEADAHAATLAAQSADAKLLASCSAFAASLACDLAKLTPDRPERRLGDSMRSFEIDMGAQYWIAKHPAEQSAFEAGDGPGKNTEMSPAYAWARSVADAKH